MKTTAHRRTTATKAGRRTSTETAGRRHALDTARAKRAGDISSGRTESAALRASRKVGGDAVAYPIGSAGTGRSHAAMSAFARGA